MEAVLSAVYLTEGMKAQELSCGYSEKIAATMSSGEFYDFKRTSGKKRSFPALS
jgi:hypothetical protein